jgi:hypothetical protein
VPFLQSVSQDFLQKSLGRKRGTILGGEASIDANFLYIDVKNTGSNTLQVFGSQPIAADYVIVGGGGGGGGHGFFDHNTLWYYSGYTALCCNDCGHCYDHWNIYCKVIDGLLFCNGLYGWSQKTTALNLTWDGGGGGAGGVLTGTVNLTSQNYSINIGSGGAGVSGAVNLSPTGGAGGTTTAFGQTALGGGGGSGGSGASGGGSSDRISGGAATQGNPGSWRGTILGGEPSGQTIPLAGKQIEIIWREGGSTTHNFSIWASANNFFKWADPFRGRNLLQPGWGGGAGAPGPGSLTTDPGPFPWSLAPTSSPEERNMQNPFSNSYTNAGPWGGTLDDRVWSPEYDPVRGANAYTYVETVSGSNYQQKLSIWSNVRWGIGVDALGLKVGGGGMSGINGRALSESYGGGYTLDATTAQGTYSRNAQANTGGGGGGGIRVADSASAGTYTSFNGGNGGSGTVRIRIKRSDIGI